MIATSSYTASAGVDVAKEHLDLFILPHRFTQRFPNTTSGRRALVHAVGEHNVSHAALESTGGYERRLVLALVDKGVAVHVAQPKVMRDFAGSMNLKAKTDQIDAYVCACFARDRRNDFHFLIAADARHERLRALMVRRDELVRMRTQEKNRLQQTLDTLVKKSITRSIGSLKREIQRVEAQLDKVIKGDAELSLRVATIRRIAGVGPQTARAVAALLPELGLEDDKRLSALVGVAPLAADSGKKTAAPRHIRGGRKLLRNMLYMACLTAMIKNQVIREHYRRLIAAGKAHKTAMMSCIRKLLACMNTRVRLALAQASPAMAPRRLTVGPASGWGARGSGAGGEAPERNNKG